MMWYIYVVLVNGKLAKIATMDPNLFLVLQLKKPLTSIAVLA